MFCSFDVFLFTICLEKPSFSDRDLRHQHGMGPYNIFILDTSSYIGEDGMNEIKETFATLMKGKYISHKI